MAQTDTATEMVEALMLENKNLESAVDHFGDLVEEYKTSEAELKAENKKLREAVEFYTLQVMEKALHEMGFEKDK